MSAFAAELELLLKQTFSISEDAECRVWHRYMTDTYELLNNSSQTLQDAGLYNEQVCIYTVPPSKLVISLIFIVACCGRLLFWK